MAHLPFFNRYPYTNFEQLNLDYIMNETSKFSKRVEDLETITADHEVRIVELRTDVEGLDDRMTAAESDIDALEGRADNLETRMTNAEGDIDTLQSDVSGLNTRLNADEGRITALETETTSQGADIQSLTNRVTTNEANIYVLQNENQRQENDITALDGRVTVLENTDKVIANPGGTGANLNTLSVSGVTYVIPSGGGGGGGSSVTPNPAGAATVDLEKVDIDGIVYGIPDSRADVTALQSDVSDIQDDITDIDNTIDKINRFEAGQGSPEAPERASFVNNNNVQLIDGTAFTINTPGKYLIVSYASFDTTSHGSNARYLGFYTRVVGGHDNSGDPWGNFNLQLDKFTVRGDEPAMITQAATMSNVAILNCIANEEYIIKLATRCYSNVERTYHVDFWYQVIRLS